MLVLKNRRASEVSEAIELQCILGRSKQLPKNIHPVTLHVNIILFTEKR